LFSSFPALAQDVSAKVLFSEQVGSDIMPIDQGNAFKNNIINIILHGEKPFEVGSIIFTIYKINLPFEELLFREELDINPSWSYFLIRDFPFVEAGTYKISFTEPHNSLLIAEGVVEILSEKLDHKEIPKTVPKESQEGKTLKEIFEQYKSKSKQLTN
jgi:hypothetical protein